MKYLVVEHSNNLVKIGSDLESAVAIRSTGLNKDCGWFIEEDGTALYKGVEYEVKKGDYVMMVYTPEAVVNKLIIIRNADLYQTYLDFKEADRKRKEEYAIRYEYDGCSDCEACN